MPQYLTGGAASRTPLLGPSFQSVQPFTRTFQTPAQVQATTAPAGGGGINKETLAAIQKAKAYYEPGGGFGKGTEAGLERGRVKAMASGMQGLVGAGLAGTTMAGTLGKKYEEEVGAPTRLGVEERRAQALSGIEMAQAGMGFRAGQAGVQSSLQLYLAQLQADLQREELAMRNRPTATITAPTGGGYARQFPSIYGEEESVPDWTGGAGGGANTPWPTMAPFGGTMYGTQEAFETSLRR